MTIKLIISDVDGCLTSEGSVPFDAPSFEHLVDLYRDGHLPPLTLCTGRPQPYVEVLVKLFGINLPAICENGAVIYTLHDNYARYGPGVTGEKLRGLRAVRAFIEEELLPHSPGTVLQFGKEAQISVFSQNPELLPPMIPRIEEFVVRQGGPALDISASHYYLNISLDGVNKGRAIQWLLEELRIDKAEVLGIGDTVGDLPIREAVGTFACPANAQEEIKKVADFIASKAEANGVAEIFEKFVTPNRAQ